MLKVLILLYIDQSSSIWLTLPPRRTFGGATGKEPMASAGGRRVRLDPWWGRSPGGGHGNPLQYSCLGNPTDRGAWWAKIHGVAKSHIQLQRLSTETVLIIMTGMRGYKHAQRPGVLISLLQHVGQQQAQNNPAPNVSPVKMRHLHRVKGFIYVLMHSQLDTFHGVRKISTFISSYTITSFSKHLDWYNCRKKKC